MSNDHDPELSSGKSKKLLRTEAGMDQIKAAFRSEDLALAESVLDGKEILLNSLVREKFPGARRMFYRALLIAYNQILAEMVIDDLPENPQPYPGDRT